MRRFFTFVIIATACLTNVQAITDNQLKALAQKLADVQGKEVYIYNKTQGKYVAQGGDAGTSTVFDDYGTVFTINSGNTISTKYGTGCYLGVSGSTVRVNLTTSQAWTFTVNTTSDGITTYSIKCGTTPIVSDESDGYVLISKEKSLEYAGNTSKKGGMIDLSALIKNSRFDRGNSETAWTFNNTGNNGYRRATDQTADYPAQNKYYHLVGVYDKEAQKVRFYKEGALCEEVDAIGKFNFPDEEKYQWFCIGGDPGPSNDYVQANQAMPGNIVAARLYSKAMTSEEVAELYGELKNPQTYTPVSLVSNIDYARNILAKSGCELPVHATGFTTVDQIQLSSTFSTDVLTYKPKVEDGVAYITFEDNIKTGKYYMTLKRGEKQQTLGTLVIVKTNTIEIPVVAHRGYWNIYSDGSTKDQNSRAALRRALENNFYAAETDVRLTTDNVLMVNHNEAWNGTTIESSNSTTCRNLDLKNGEKMPTLENLLDIMLEEQYNNSNTKLVIEIKTNSEDAGLYTYNTVNQSKYASLKDRIEFISFNTAPLNKIHNTDPTAIIQLLRDEKSTATTKTPADVKKEGWHGIDYDKTYLGNNMSWYDSAHTNGLFVNVWTINTADEATTQRYRGADFLTANNPLEVKKLYELDARYKEYYDLNSNK